MASERLRRQIDRLLDEAEAALGRREWDAVRNCARDILAIDPANADARAFLAAAERALGVQQPRAEKPKARPEEPSSFAGGRYEVKRFLGEGGKKKVYLAHDTLLDRDVAFALIKTENLDDAARARITREAQAMGKLGSHPHIVTIFDLGQQGGQPYLVTELMGGGAVEDLIEKTPQHRVPLERTLEIAVEVCRGLEFAHSRGLVHRDLKPGNVWLSSEGRAKIGDFGLALPLNRARLTQEGMMIGTVSYMPPEQATGGEVTPRADLYSLGCMLYEMVTGRPPFMGDDPVAIIGQHINTAPVSPSWHCPGCPKPLEALVMRLLAKDPAQRPESARDVLAALEAIDITAVAEKPPEEAASLDSLAGGVFVGRHREMGELKAALEEALSGRGRLVVLVGEPGIGKTRTAVELATYADLRSAQVLWGRCYESRGVPPYWPWVQAIRSYVRGKDARQLRAEMGAGAADIAEIVSDVRQRIPDLQSAPRLEGPDAARFRLFDSIAAFLKSAASRQPLVLILDDLHWSDEPSLLLLQFVAGELASSRLMVVGAYRDVKLSRKHPLARALGEMTKERAFQRVLLRGLGREDVGRFIELTAGARPPAGLVGAVYTQTEGNPLFVNEVVRLLVQEGELVPERLRERKSWTVRIPEGVREVVGRRLDRLSERCNQVLGIASVIGRDFTMRQLGAVVEDLSEEMLLEVLEEALRARVMEELPRAAGRYQFTHALIQETLAGELSAARKVRLHARIAGALEKLYGDGAQVRAAELAYHFSEAEPVLGSEKVIKYSLLAGERALASFAPEEALAHFQRGLAAKEGKPMDMETANLLSGLGRAQASALKRTELQQAVDSLRRAFDYYVTAGDTKQAVAVARYPFPSAHGPRGMAELVGRALKLVPPDSPDAGYLQARYGMFTSMETGDFTTAEKAFEQALSIARARRDTRLELRTLTDSLVVYMWNLNMRKTHETASRILELCRTLDDPQAEALARLMAWWYAANATGDTDKARVHMSSALALAERLGDRHLICSVLFMNAQLARWQGDWATARQNTDRALALDSLEVRILHVRVQVESEVGDFEAADVYLERVVEFMHLQADAPYADGYGAVFIAYSEGTTGRSERRHIAEAAARRAVAAQFTERIVVLFASWALALIAIQRGDPAEAGKQYAALEGFGEGFREYRGSGSDRTLGLLACTMGQLDRAAAHFEDALAFCRKAGYRPELAWTCCDYADTLLKRNAAGDSRKATQLLDEALAISRELGMRPLMERVLSRRKLLKA